VLRQGETGGGRDRSSAVPRSVCGRSGWSNYYTDRTRSEPLRRPVSRRRSTHLPPQPAGGQCWDGSGRPGAESLQDQPLRGDPL